MCKCGSYHPDKIVDPKEASAICPDCGHPHKFKQLPLFVITGASGTGKTSTCIGLSEIMSEVVVMDGDILWMEEFNQPVNRFMEVWLRVSKNISQGGRPVVLCCFMIPSHLENCIESRYFSNAEKESPKFTLLDTNYDSFETTVEKIRKWILEKI